MKSSCGVVGWNEKCFLRVQMTCCALSLKDTKKITSTKYHLKDVDQELIEFICLLSRTDLLKKMIIASVVGNTHLILSQCRSIVVLYCTLYKCLAIIHKLIQYRYEISLQLMEHHSPQRYKSQNCIKTGWAI